MRTALLSDIHGNLVALDAVLSDLESAAPDAILCLGDVIVTGPQPRQVLDRLRELNWPTVMGNTDAWILDPQPWNTNDEDARRLEAIEYWGVSLLVGEDRAFIRTFQPTLTLELGGGLNLLCYHGSPKSNLDYIGPTTPDEELEVKLAGHREALMAGGHTHQQMLRRYQSSLLLNPGSVGMPYETAAGETRNPPWAEYALVTNKAGQLQVEFRRIPFDLDQLVEAVKQSGMPHADWWLGDWK